MVVRHTDISSPKGLTSVGGGRLDDFHCFDLENTRWSRIEPSSGERNADEPNRHADA